MFFFLDNKSARMCYFNFPLNNPSDFKGGIIFLDLQIKWNARERGKIKRWRWEECLTQIIMEKNYFVLDKPG